MKIDFHHDINYHPELEDAGTIRINARIFCEDDILTFKTSSLAEEFINDEKGERRRKEKLEDFLIGARISEDDIDYMLLRLVDYVHLVTCPASWDYSPDCLLNVRLDLDLLPDDDDDDLDYDGSQIEEEAVQVSFDDDDFDDDDDLDEDDSQVEEEAVQVSFDNDDLDEDNLCDGDCQIEEEAAQLSFHETSNIRLLRPASKLVVKSLTRTIYNTKTKKEEMKKNSVEECKICLQEFSNGARLVTLTCGHDFDDECIVKWFETSRVCPMCSFELPCEELGSMN